MENTYRRKFYHQVKKTKEDDVLDDLHTNNNEPETIRNLFFIESIEISYQVILFVWFLKNT